MTGLLLSAAQRVRATARDLCQADGFVSVVYQGSVGGEDAPVTVHFRGRRQFSPDCGMLLDGGVGQVQAGSAEEPSGVLHFLAESHRQQSRVDAADKKSGKVAE